MKTEDFNIEKYDLIAERCSENASKLCLQFAEIAKKDIENIVDSPAEEHFYFMYTLVTFIGETLLIREAQGLEMYNENVFPHEKMVDAFCLALKDLSEDSNEKIAQIQKAMKILRKSKEASRGVEMH